MRRAVGAEGGQGSRGGGNIIKGSQILAFDRVVWRGVRGGGRERKERAR